VISFVGSNIKGKILVVNDVLAKEEIYLEAAL
jgi:hypothetical protein